MELREALKRINKVCQNQIYSCAGCPLDSKTGCILGDDFPPNIDSIGIDKVCKAVEQMGQEEQSIENAQLYVINHLDARTKLEQLAEEAAELSQAALKLIRAKGMSDNATPISREEALQNLEEEIVDVLMCIKAYDPELNVVDVVKAMENSPKWLRWAERLKGETNNGKV